ncbi:uncharacterized protein EAF02_005511 [Botrytis sinoallii]|uniref:uncharacterized protein n=1 Tax=Botrytis sinoallii TaxID=1463999 RepID=UPI0019005033|nr:uncharacterized protein EAF02_005511 [Botrytis sinoallii]KAF7883591.1 hypothetical protein EAF02_005511 [Botrytis sinoallii]
MAKSVFIAAATGEQRRPLFILLLQLGYKVKILVRVSSSSAAQALRVLGAEVHTGNLESFGVVSRAISGADTIYLALPPNLKNEILYAKNVLEAAQQEKVTQVEYPSAQYWIQKGEIEKMVRTLGFSYWTILRPAFFMQSFCCPKCDHMFLGLSELQTPRIAFLPSTLLDLISVGDIARFTTKVIQSPNRYSKKTLTLAAEKLSAAEIADRLGAVSGKEITVEYLPNLVARALRKQGNGVVGAQIWQRDVRYNVDIDALSEYGVSLTPMTEALSKESLNW